MFASNIYVMAQKKYVSMRLTEETMAWAKDLRTAFESCYLHRFTFDDFMEKLRACVKDADPAVWEKYCEIQQMKEGML